MYWDLCTLVSHILGFVHQGKDCRYNTSPIRYWVRAAKPDPCCALQRCREGPTHDLVWYSLEVHQGFEGLQMIEWVLDPIVALNLQHSEFLW